MFVVNFSLSKHFVWSNIPVIIRLNNPVIPIFTIKYFEQFYDKLGWQEVSKLFNRVPTGSLRKFYYALILRIWVLDYPYIFFTLLLTYYIHIGLFPVSFVGFVWIIWYPLQFLMSNTLLERVIQFINQLFYTWVSHYYVYENKKNNALQCLQRKKYEH